MGVYRLFVEKKDDFALDALSLREDLRESLGLPVGRVRVFQRYDLENLSEETFRRACRGILAEPQSDRIYEETLPDLSGMRVFAVEFLPGQFDQRADSCEQCIRLAAPQERPVVRSATVYALEGGFTDEAFTRIKQYLINPVECREASMDKPDTLRTETPPARPVEILRGFRELSGGELPAFLEKYALAMDADDLEFCRGYFRDEEKRDPTLSELRMIDTYWSDHCRHTTFLTELTEVAIDDPRIQASFDEYQMIRSRLGRDQKPVTLMDLATIGARALKAAGRLPDLDESEEINACTVKIRIDTKHGDEDWLLLFKNETHNHPTEIEPFGGAATCLGGAIRDPLSGRGYVYQAMRVTGAADPRVPVGETLAGKLPQKKICVTAAEGYSSYGNQIGLATGLVKEYYHPGYAAKRMELGAVLGAAPASNVRRETPLPGDIVLLIGGRTGRDGCGGATGSSKAHTVESLAVCGAEVQKGNPPEERKLQRLFRNPDAARLIKRCNDFGAGGVSVAVGELADGLDINLNALPQKYEGMDGTELAISESQERMAVVVAKEDCPRFLALAAEENLLAAEVAVVTEDPRLIMRWNGETIIISLSRSFLNSNGARKTASVHISARPALPKTALPAGSFAEALSAYFSDLRRCSRRGLCERFDSTIGAATVLLPFGGRTQRTPIQAMAAKIPVEQGDTRTCSLMAEGFDPYLSEADPFRGALLAVVESVAKVIAAGGDERHCWLSLQEYFPRTKGVPERWGLPMAALLGALTAQLRLGIGAIGGKDSMSGSFEQLDVPPTLVSFAVSLADVRRVVSPELKGAENRVYLLLPEYGPDGLPDFDSIKQTFVQMRTLIAAGIARSVWAITADGALDGLLRMTAGNRVGLRIEPDVTMEELLDPRIGGFLFETEQILPGIRLLGVTEPEYRLTFGGETVDLSQIENAHESTLEKVYPTKAPAPEKDVPVYTYMGGAIPSVKVPSKGRPKVMIPVFPGTNCETDTARAFERAGAEARIVVVRNLTGEDIERSAERAAKAIADCQIIALPGGFSGGDEPDGSAKLITAFFRSAAVTEAVTDLLERRDGLMIGICNGFQALIKLGLLPNGRICGVDEHSPTLARNRIGRHQSMLVRTRICTDKSPWLRRCRPGDIHAVAVSHGEGRFVADSALLAKLAENGQIATQYVDLDGKPTMEVPYNPNGSCAAVEGILSPDGRILGKMGHSERFDRHIYRNVPGDKDQLLFESAVDYLLG